MNRVAKQYVLPYLWITLASAVYAVGFNWCYEPNQIGFGGITGVGQIINHILPWAPIGTVVIILNIPLFLLGWCTTAILLFTAIIILRIITDSRRFHIRRRNR